MINIFNTDNKQKIKDYLLTNQDVFKCFYNEIMLQETIDSEHPIFEDIIIEQYIDKIKREIVLELVKVLNVSSEECYEVIDDWNLKVFLC